MPIVIDGSAGTVTGISAGGLPDNSITNAEMADNAIGLAELAGIARGKIIYGDSSGDPAVLSPGSADQVLTSDGTDISWAAAGGGLFTRGWYDKDTTATTITPSSGEVRIGGSSGADFGFTFTPPSTNARYLVRAHFHFRKHTGTGQWGWRVQYKPTGGSWTALGMMQAAYGNEWADGQHRTSQSQELIFHPSTTTELTFGMFCQVWSSHNIQIDANASGNSSFLTVLEIPDNSLITGI